MVPIVFELDRGVSRGLWRGIESRIGHRSS